MTGHGENPALLILAAGEGSRMRSRTPKLLHPVCDRSILRHIVRMGQELGAKPIVIVAGAAEAEFREELRDEPVEFVRQAEPLGTGHATLQARHALEGHLGPIIVMAGDHPLYRAETFQKLVREEYRKGRHGEQRGLPLFTQGNPVAGETLEAP